MTDFETAARGQRAALCDEFIGPNLREIKAGYLARMADVAATELDPKKRAEKITALSIALKVVGNLENGLNAAIESGRLAEKSIIKAESIEKLGAERRRVFDLVPSL
jgi:hypothetical protein